MQYINKGNVSNLLLGSAFLGTGGGIPLKAHKKIYESAFREKQNLIMKDVREFHAGHYLATIYMVGDPSKVRTNLKDTLIAAFADYQKMTGIRMHGIIPGEIGAEGVAFQASVYADLPVIDSDLVGGRAAPEISMDVFALYQIPLTPTFAVSLKGNSILLSGNISSHEIEETTRNFFKKNGGIGLLIGYPIRAGAYKKIAIQGTISRAMEMGNYLATGNIEGLLKKFGGSMVAKRTITAVNLKSGGDFLSGSVHLQEFELRVKNENIELLQKNKQIAAAPDIITLLQKNGTPIHNSEITDMKGREAIIVTLPAFGYWKQKENKALWKSAFSNASSV